MRKRLWNIAAAMIGALCAGAAAALAWALFRNLGLLVGMLGRVLGESAAQTLSLVFAGLQSAKILPPVWPALLVGALLGWAWMKNGRHIAWKAIALAVLFFPLCVLFANVNGIRVLSALQIALRLAKNLF